MLPKCNWKPICLTQQLLTASRVFIVAHLHRKHSSRFIWLFFYRFLAFFVDFASRSATAFCFNAAKFCYTEGTDPAPPNGPRAWPNQCRFQFQFSPPLPLPLPHASLREGLSHPTKAQRNRKAKMANFTISTCCCCCCCCWPFSRCCCCCCCATIFLHNFGPFFDCKPERGLGASSGRSEEWAQFAPLRLFSPLFRGIFKWAFYARQINNTYFI